MHRVRSASIHPNVVSVHDSGMERAIGELGLLMREVNCWAPLSSEDVVHVAEVAALVVVAHISGGRPRVSEWISHFRSPSHPPLYFWIPRSHRQSYTLTHSFAIGQIFSGGPYEVRFLRRVELILMIFVERVYTFLNVAADVFVSQQASPIVNSSHFAVRMEMIKLRELHGSFGRCSTHADK